MLAECETKNSGTVVEHTHCVMLHDFEKEERQTRIWRKNSSMDLEWGEMFEFLQSPRME